MMLRTALDEELGNKKRKIQEGEDLISALPDSIIHHILSFFDSTKEAIQTCVLSKRWKNQWTGVPVLIFDLYGKSYEYSSRFIDNTLDRHDCSKIQKFHILTNDYTADRFPYFNEKISSGLRKHAEEIILGFLRRDFLTVTESIFDHASLVKLHAHSCIFKPNGKVSWDRLKELELRHSKLPDNAVDNILSGSPLLESLILDCDGINRLVIVSKYLKILELVVHRISVIDISCPNLEELDLFGCLAARPIELRNLVSLNCAILDFGYDVEDLDLSLPRKILQQLQHAKELVFGNALLKILSSLEVRAGLSPPLLNNKCLTLDCPEVDENPAGIAYALRCSHLLEKLVISKEFLIVEVSDLENLEGYWSTNKTVFNCLVSHLKFVDVINLSKRDVDYKYVLNFVEFLLKNAEVLEKLLVVFENCDMDFLFEVSRKLLSVPRCSKHVKIEFSNVSL